MKQIFLYLLLLTGIPALAQKQTKLKINLTAEHDRLFHIDRLSPDTIKLFRLPEDTLALTIASSIIRRSFEIKHVPVGAYRVQYRNMYRELMTRQISLMKMRVNEISLCVDSLDSYPQNTLARLQYKDSIQLNYAASYCEGFDTATVVITKEHDHFVVSMHRVFGERTLEGLSYSEGKPPVRTAILTDQQINAFVKFENELVQLTNIKSEKKVNGRTLTVEYGCTTTERYTIKSNYFNFEKEDRGCRWEGFDQLMLSLFGSKY